MMEREENYEFTSPFIRRFGELDSRSPQTSSRAIVIHRNRSCRLGERCAQLVGSSGEGVARKRHLIGATGSHPRRQRLADSACVFVGTRNRRGADS
jgi:hypothetical protein